MNMKTLNVRWQRLVDDRGATCDRCSSTGDAVEKAAGKLLLSLRPLGIEIVLEKTELSPSVFGRDPLESNRIWIDGIPLEEWLSASTGSSRCCSSCGDSDCRTVTVEGRTYEAVPAHLIVKAGLIAASRLLGCEPEGECCR